MNTPLERAGLAGGAKDSSPLSLLFFLKIENYVKASPSIQSATTCHVFHEQGLIGCFLAHNFLPSFRPQGSGGDRGFLGGTGSPVAPPNIPVVCHPHRHTLDWAVPSGCKCLCLHSLLDDILKECCPFRTLSKTNAVGELLLNPCPIRTHPPLWSPVVYFYLLDSLYKIAHPLLELGLVHFICWYGY